MPRNGFTLVELLIVIAVMALLAGVAVMTVGSPGNAPADEASRFAGRLAAARDQAILTGRPISAWVSRSGYGFDQLREGRWQPLAEKPFKGDDWGSGMDVAVAGAGADRTRVRFDSLGTADQALGVRLSQSGQSAAVRVAPNGEVMVE